MFKHIIIFLKVRVMGKERVFTRQLGNRLTKDKLKMYNETILVSRKLAAPYSISILISNMSAFIPEAQEESAPSAVSTVQGASNCLKLRK